MKILIYTEATGIYKEYAELWKLCINHFYPQYDVKLNFPHCDSKTPIYYAACNRFLTNQDKYPYYDYIYVTDIDMMIISEDVDLHEFHIREMELENNCYSNTPRKKEKLGPKRLTGLHFASREWYQKTHNVRIKFSHMLGNGEIGNGRFDDELMLMQICKQSGLKIPPTKGLIARHHGIHLGTIRAYINHNWQKQRQQFLMRITLEQAKKWILFTNCDDYRKVVAKIKNKAIKDELRLLYAFCRSYLNG